jgi:hypothetical protein
MKIDIEGHELAALRGAAATIQDGLPNLLIEADERHRKDAVISVIAFLSKYDYSGLFHVHGDLHPIGEFDTLTHQNSSIGDKPYINNFIFVHKSKMTQFQAAIRNSHFVAGSRRLAMPFCGVTQRS